MAAILKLQCYIGNPTLPIDAYLLEEQFCQISSRSCLKRRSLTFFWRDRPNKKNKDDWRYETSPWSKQIVLFSCTSKAALIACRYIHYIHFYIRLKRRWQIATIHIN